MRNGKSGVCAEKLKNIVLFVGARSSKASVKLLNDFNELGLGVRFEVFKIDGFHGVLSFELLKVMMFVDYLDEEWKLVYDFLKIIKGHRV